MTVGDLPLLNAVLNTTSTVFLLLGYYFIRQKKKVTHKKMMITALVTSGLFLISYLIYHYNVGSVKFTGQGTVRTVYFIILISHTILAILLPPLVGITLVRALRERFDKHRVIARWTLPIWLYVSITGVAVYLMLYQLFPPTM
jgi:putative membrane protein